jgi:hypothetical protein
MGSELGLRIAIPGDGTENELLGSCHYRIRRTNCQENVAEFAKSRGHFVHFLGYTPAIVGNHVQTVHAFAHN